MPKEFHWENEIGNGLKKFVKKLELPKLKEELPLSTETKFELDPLKLKDSLPLGPLSTSSFQMKEPLFWKERHEEFVHRSKYEMDQKMKMQKQIEMGNSQKRINEMELRKKETTQLLKNHFDSVERTFGPIAEPLVPKFKI